MSTQILRVRECLHLDYPVQGLINDRYVAQIVAGFGVCVYDLDVQGVRKLYASTFPLPDRTPTLRDIQDCYVQFTLTFSQSSGYGFADLRKQYRYLPEVPDLLTLKCLLLEAEQHWRDTDARMENGDTDPLAGEGVV